MWAWRGRPAPGAPRRSACVAGRIAANCSEVTSRSHVFWPSTVIQSSWKSTRLAVGAPVDVELDVLGAERERPVERDPGVLQLLVAARAAAVRAEQDLRPRPHSAGAVRGVRRRRATRPASRPTSAAVSGCHCTPRRNGARAVLHGLQRAIIRPRDGEVPRVCPHRLVVVAAHLQPVADQPREPGAGDGVHRDRRRTRRRRGVLLVVDQVRDVLVEHAAGVHAPSPACPGTRRAPAGPGRLRGVEQGDLPGVPVGPPGGRPRVRRSPYRAGSTSAPPLITSPSRRATATVRRRRSARPAAAARVRRRSPRPPSAYAVGQQVGALLPHPPGRVLAVGGEVR